MEKKIVISFIAVAVIFSLFGGITGIFLANILPRHQQAQKIANVVLSKTISSLSATGIVQSINGRNITLSREGDSITIVVPEKMPVYTPGEENGIQQKTDFSQIREGDSITVGLKANNQNQLEGQSVILFGSR